MELTSKQQVQEEEYAFPYHWAIEPDSLRGRVYFGYLSLCLAVLKSSFPSLVGLKILDAGSGDGRFLKMLEDAGVANLHGVDYSKRAIAFASLLVPQATFAVSDLARIDDADESFDCVFLIETLEHIVPERIDGIVKELRRVLKKGGLLVVTVPSVLSGVPSASSKHYQHFSVGTLEAYLKPHFSKVEFRGQDKIGLLVLRILYRFVDNSVWQIKSLARYYNQFIWPKLFNSCDPSEARRLIAVCRK